VKNYDELRKTSKSTLTTFPHHLNEVVVRRVRSLFRAAPFPSRPMPLRKTHDLHPIEIRTFIRNNTILKYLQKKTQDQSCGQYRQWTLQFKFKFTIQSVPIMFSKVFSVKSDNVLHKYPERDAVICKCEVTTKKIHVTRFQFNFMIT
jgi:hypothetical protein